MKLLLIDGNHLAFRVAYAHASLTYGNRPTGMLYGFMKSLIAVRRSNPMHHVIVAWDSKSLRREAESTLAVVEGYIPSAYKANRDPTDDDPLRKAVYSQLPVLRKYLDCTLCQQVKVPGFEGDDVIASYVLQYDYPTIIVTGDKDFYQLLEKDVTIDDQLHNETWTTERFIQTYGLHAPQLWVDVKALAGDSGDNIFNAPGIGEGTALKLIKRHGTVENVITHCKATVTRTKVEQKIVDHERRIRLAYSLSMMDEVPSLPPPTAHRSNAQELLRLFDEVGFHSLYDSIDLIT